MRKTMVHNFLYGSLSWGILWMALLLGGCKDSVEEPGFDDAYARVPQSVVMATECRTLRTDKGCARL